MGKVISIEKARGGARFKPMATRGLRAAATPPTSFDPKARTFTFVLATERPCQTYRWAGWDVVEVNEVLPMSGLVEIERLVGSPILNSHSSWNLSDVIGVITGAVVEGDKLVCTGQLSERSDVADIARDIGAGVLTSMSVGFQIVEDGLAFERDGDVPLVTVKRWKALEASVVPVPADDDAKIRGGRRPSTRNTAPRQGARGMTPDELKTLLTTTFATVGDEIELASSVWHRRIIPVGADPDPASWPQIVVSEDGWSASRLETEGGGYVQDGFSPAALDLFRLYAGFLGFGDLPVIVHWRQVYMCIVLGITRSGSSTATDQGWSIDLEEVVPS